jgi:hypothetical protein
MFRPEKVRGPFELKLPPVLEISPGADKVTAPPDNVEIARVPNSNLVFAAVF